MPRTAPILLLLLFWSGSPLPAQTTGADDPWIGRPAAEIVARLGEPNKRKKSTEGTQVLIYKVILFEGGVAPTGDVRLFEIPDVGLAGVPIKGRGIDPGSSTALQPTSFDEQGRSVEGGVETSESMSISHDLESGETTTTGTPEKKAPRGRKAQLVFHVDGSGRIVRWELPQKR